MLCISCTPITTAAWRPPKSKPSFSNSPGSPASARSVLGGVTVNTLTDESIDPQGFRADECQCLRKGLSLVHGPVHKLPHFCVSHTEQIHLGIRHVWNHMVPKPLIVVIQVFHGDIEGWKVPFLNKGTAEECCAGAYLARFGHKTVALKCFETSLTARSAVCAHCEQLWAHMSDDNVYEVKDDMDAARARYAKGERRVMRNWEGMKDLQDVYSNEIQIVKDVVQGSEFEVASQWPGMSYAQAQRVFLQDAGVLFADAGRGRNPYNRTAHEQKIISEFAHDMLRKFLRIAVTVKPEELKACLLQLQEKTKLIQNATMWTM